ncbi:MAG: LysR family transcriptional regulator [Moritella sp.]|uniref:LysR family transcriptional regulator n=1 Tax=Moritella sp. TaxID=78556 RepID=UPI0029B7B808|nr:LysR family transcriptional regulator [Moritella sp.]MDX2320883.1 LysR family transcriptional regulator [Moritella sp.]
MKASMDDLYLFILTVRHGGISAAAQAHGLQRSKVSRRLQELEKALGCQLLIRTTRQIEMTEHGRLLYQHINQPLSDVNQAISLLKNQQQSLQGVLRIAVPAAFIASALFSELLDDYARQFPDINLEIFHRHQSVDLKRENIDLQLLPDVLDIINEDYVQQVFLPSKKGLLCSPGYLKSHDKPQCLNDLFAHSILTSHNDPSLLPEGLNIRLMSEDLGLINHMAQSGHGIALLPMTLVQQQIKQGELIHLLPDIYQSEISMTLIYSSRQFLPQKTRTMINLLRDKFLNHH